MLSRIDPLRALIWLESTVVVLAFASETLLRMLHQIPAKMLIAPAATFAYFTIAIVTTWIIFSIPHAPNRRYALTAIAIIGIAGTRAFPEHFIVPQALLIVFAGRIVFASGLRGLGLAYVPELLGAAGLGIVGHSLGLMTPFQAIFEAFVDFFFFGLIFGLIGITWLYSERASRAAAAAERMRIAYDLHDALGHRLTTLNVQLQNIARLRATDPEKADAYVGRATVTASEALADVRQAVALLQNDASAAAPPLPILLERLHDDFVATHGIDVTWQAHVAHDPPGRIGVEIHRMLQEALTNIARHAEARRIEVNVRGGDAAIDVIVRDDGVGFEDAGVGGHGLTSMRARIESIGGTFSVASAVGRGTRIAAHVPLEANI